MRLDRASSSTVSVRYATRSSPPAINARPGVDYTRGSGIVVFAPGHTLAWVDVTIRAAAAQRNDLFLVAFTRPAGATVGGYYGFGLGVIS